MPDGLLAVYSLPRGGIAPIQLPPWPFRYSLVIPVRTEPAEDLAERQLLGDLTPSELIIEIVETDGALDVVR